MASAVWKPILRRTGCGRQFEPLLILFKKKEIADLKHTDGAVIAHRTGTEELYLCCLAIISRRDFMVFIEVTEKKQIHKDRLLNNYF